MKNAAQHMDAILRRIEKRGCVLMLDFDGVLSPIVKSPSAARISKDAHAAILACAKRMPVAVISGRTLSDVRKRVGIPGLVYAGSHGLEWHLYGRTHRRSIPRSTLSAFAAARRALLKYARDFPRLLVQEKMNAFALGYRKLSKKQADEFRRGARALVGSIASAEAVRIIDDLYTFEVVPVSKWTKGECARHIFETVGKRGAIPVYIGDTLTDEDAFSEFAKDGITIRVGKSSTSAAQFYFSSRSRVDAFLAILAQH